MASGIAVTALACASTPPDAGDDRQEESAARESAAPRDEAEIAHLTSPVARFVARDSRVEMRVAERLDQAQRARVMVTLDVPELRAEGARTYDHPDFARAQRAIARASGDVLAGLGPIEVHHRFQSLNAVVVTVTTEQAAKLVTLPGITRVSLDEDGGAMHGVPDLQLSHFDVAQAEGLSGAGTTVAILDTGIDLTHPDLGPRVVDQACFCTGSSNGAPGTGCCPGGATKSQGAGVAQDDNGHGTNVAGIVASAGTLAPRGGAPSAQLIAIKVLDAQGNFCCSSDVLAGFDWILTNRHDVRVVNASLGTFQLFENDCDSDPAASAWATAINSLRSNGVLVVSSSGNGGSFKSMGLPACVKSAISVGAVWDAALTNVTTAFCNEASTQPDQITCFSNSDPSLDILAPGAFVTSTGLMSAPTNGVSTYHGTSQASPYVASCAALLLQRNPSATPDKIEAALKGSPTRIADRRNNVVAPRLDCADAIARITPPACTPNCTSKQCGDDGCGHSCGTCGAGTACSSAQQCVTTCTPHCSGKQCGDDGCGHSCGTCSGNATCSSDGQCQAPTTGGGSNNVCAGVAPYDPNENWTTYTPHEKHTSQGKLYTCENRAFCQQYDPAGPFGAYGWVFVAKCQ